MNRHWVPVALAAFMLAVVACGAPTFKPIPPPEGGPSRDTTTTAPPPDLREVPLDAVAGNDPPDLRIEGGSSVLRGTVFGPEGPVPGAIVRVVRLTTEGQATADVATDEAGNWELLDVLGGVYRIRAFLPPTLTVPDPEIFLLKAEEEKRVDLSLRQFGGIDAAVTFDPPEPIVGEQVAVTLLLTIPSVNAEGRVIRSPVATGSATLTHSTSWKLLTRNPENIGVDGRVSWGLRCDAAGTPTMRATLDTGQVFDLGAPNCAEPPPPEPVEGEGDAPPTSA